MPRPAGVPDSDPAQRATFGSAQSRRSGAYLRYQMCRIGGLHAARPGTDRSPAATGYRSMSADNGAKAAPRRSLGRGLSALFDETRESVAMSDAAEPGQGDNSDEGRI